MVRRYEQGKIIVFVKEQEKCDAVFRDLLRAGYPCLSLHGGKEQTDRECTIADFKSDVCNILVRRPLRPRPACSFIMRRLLCSCSAPAGSAARTCS